MDKLEWCKKQRKGIKLIEPSINLSQSHMARAKADLSASQKIGEIWNVIISYYSCYNALYSVLLRFGIKCEIHSCSIHLCRYFKHLKGFEGFLADLKENRTNTQYYFEEPQAIDKNKLNEFIRLCELELYEVNSDKIRQVREFLR